MRAAGRRPMPLVEFDGQVYSVRSRKIEIPNLSEMPRIEALLWLYRNTYSRGHQRAPNALAGYGGAIQVQVAR